MFIFKFFNNLAKLLIVLEFGAIVYTLTRLIYIIDIDFMLMALGYMAIGFGFGSTFGLKAYCTKILEDEEESK